MTILKPFSYIETELDMRFKIKYLEFYELMEVFDVNKLKKVFKDNFEDEDEIKNISKEIERISADDSNEFK